MVTRYALAKMTPSKEVEAAAVAALNQNHAPTVFAPLPNAILAEIVLPPPSQEVFILELQLLLLLLLPASSSLEDIPDKVYDT